MSFPTEKIEKCVRAEFPILYLISWEEHRIEEALKLIAKKHFQDYYKFYTWSCTDGIKGDDGEIENSNDVLYALNNIVENDDRGFYLFKDLHFFINDPKVIRKLKDLYQKLNNSSKTLFILSPSLVLPSELEKEITVFDIGLPDKQEAREIFDNVIGSFSEKPQNAFNSEKKEKCINAMLGLGASEMELALKRIFLGERDADVEIVDALLDEKAQLVRKTGTLEFITKRIGLDDIGGLDNLKEWLNIRAFAFSEDAKEFGLDMPKGVLVMGISGCGKSLCAKSVAAVWSLPLLRLDLNQVYSGLFGTPEEAFRNTIKTVEAVAPCVLWIDEIEAGITRSGEKTSDSPASRIFGTFLTWMQEKNYPVFVAATANQIDLLPPEILRKGRFDEIFFVTLPSQNERKEIFRIHLQARGKDPRHFNIESLAKNTAGLSGAEIEQAVCLGAF